MPLSYPQRIDQSVNVCIVKHPSLLHRSVSYSPEKFYNLCLQITKAKATIDSIAASIDAGTRREDNLQEPVFVEQVRLEPIL